MSAAVDDITTEQFNATVSSHDTVVVDFWAPWCGPCKSFAPVFEQAASEHPDIKFVKVNTDQEQALAAHFGVRSIPTLMILREQVIVFRQPGALPRGALDDILSQVQKLDMAEVRRAAQPYDPNEPNDQG